jgi:hypothetical protein
MDTAMTAYLLASEQDTHDVDLYGAGAPCARADLRQCTIVLLASLWALVTVLLLSTLR